MKKLDAIPRANGKSTMDARRYRASLAKKSAKKRSNTMSQDSRNDLHATSCEPNNKRKRVGLENQDPEVTQRYICSSDGVMTPCQQSYSPPKDVYRQELARSSQIDGSPISKVKEKKVGANEISRSSQMDGLPISKVKEKKVGANEAAISSQMDGLPISKEKEKKVGANEVARSSQMDVSPISKVKSGMVGANEIPRSTQVNGSPISKVKEKKVCADEVARSSQMDGSPISKMKEKKVGADENGVEGSSKSPSVALDNLREYLVPVPLTDIQLEQYCSTLITNSGLLCSSSKKGSLDPLQDVLGALRKCCDHPYVLDSKLQSFRKERCPSADYLSIGIQASGKLQLLSKFLPEVRDKGLRVLIVYKSQTPSSSEKNCLGIGDILDDFICQSFGQESYVHFYTQSFVPPKEKQAAIDLFNDKTSGRFVILTEYSSPSVSIRLTCVDVVIVFNSDWNPVNDIRALQKLSLHTENDHLRVLRLYSLCTLEDKALYLARDGSSLTSIKQVISASNCQMLLTWGAAYHFDKLDALHVSNISESTKSSENEFFSSVLCELSTLLSSDTDDTSVNCSVISKVNKAGEYFSENIKLHGELEVQSLDDVPPHVIWSSLLPGRRPHWHFLPNESESVKRRMPLWERLPEMSEGGLRETGVVYEELPGWYRDSSHIARRSKRVPGCTLGFQQRIQEIKRRMLENQDMEILENVKESLDKYQLEKDSISEPCGVSLPKLDRLKKLDDEIELGGLCHEMDKCWENLFAPRTNEEEMRLKRIKLLKNLPEDSDDADADVHSAFIDSGNSNSWRVFPSESAVNTLKDDKIYTLQELSPSERLNMVNGNDLLHDAEISTDNLTKSLSRQVSFNYWNVEEVASKNDQNQASGGLLSSSMPVSDGLSLEESQSTSNRLVSHDDFEIFHECLPTEDMIVAIGSGNEQIYARSVPVPVDESVLPILPSIKELDAHSDPIVPDNLNASDCVPPLLESELGAKILEKDHNLVPDNLNTSDCVPPLLESELGAKILENDHNLVPDNLNTSDCVPQHLESELGADILEEDQNLVPDNLNTSECVPKLLESELGADILEKDHNLVPDNLNTSDCVPPLLESELGANILETDHNQAPEIAPSCSLPITKSQGSIDGMQSSEEVAVPSIYVNPDDEQMPQQQCIDQSCRLPVEQPASTQLPSSEIRVTDESRPSPYCSYVGNGDCSRNSNSHQPARLEPLQAELGKIVSSVNEVMKKHEDKVVLLKAARDKEMAQIFEKYSLLFQNAKNNFLQKRDELKVCYEKTKAHILLAEAWRQTSDENSPMFDPPSLVQTNAFVPSPQMVNQFSDLISTDQIARPPYPPLHHQNLCNSEAGWRPYIQNPYLCPSLPTPHPLNFTLSADYYSQYLSSGEYLLPYNIPI